MECLKQINIPKLENDDKLACKCKLSVEESLSALLSMGNGKSSGSDDLTRGLHIYFGRILALFL